MSWVLGVRMGTLVLKDDRNRGMERMEVGQGDARKLAGYLRAHPEATELPAHQLADQFNLPIPFVESVIRSLDAPRTRRNPEGAKPVANAVLAVVGRLRNAFRKATTDPVAFIGVTTALAIALFLAINVQYGGRPGLIDEGPGGGFSLEPQGTMGAFWTIACSTLLVHLACYFRHGMVRHALVGSLLAWVISSATLIVLAWLRFADRSAEQLWFMSAVLSFLMLFLSGMYGVLSTAAAVTGGLFWVRRQEKERRNRSRQELIEYLFDLQQRLAKADDEVEAEPDEFSLLHAWLDKVRRRLVPMAIGLGIAFCAVEMGVTAAFVKAVGFESLNRTPLFLLSFLGLRVLEVALMASVAFAARRFLYAMALATLFIGASLPMKLLPIQPFGIEWVRDALQVDGLLYLAISVVVVAGIATMGARVEERAANQRQLGRDDKAAITAEIVKTEWQLALQTTNVCVLVVDVAKSSAMKSQANPLEVEYSFREYQRYVKETCALFEGQVHSTAGDGAVVAFSNCLNAFEAARRLHTGLDNFNDCRNRLITPFRLRIGLHVGPVAGDLGDVQFSEVIDIAAHVESNAPVGGIALTQPVAEQLPGARLAMMQERISGLGVFIALNPTLDQPDLSPIA